ncbi:MAG: DNA repair protein [Pedobacter sp.]|nr:MAG: DNA repair protein [Pedobacter sp.]
MVQEKETLQVVEIALTYRPHFNASELPKITSAEDAYKIFLNHWDMGRIQLLEEFRVLLLSRSNKALGVALISSGGVSGTVVDPKVVFAIALKAKASSIILAHNHPSGNINTSLVDKQITKKLKQGGEMLDIQVCDHIIVTNDGFYSYSDDGLM